MGFSRPQLVVVSGLFWWESLDGWDFLGHNLLLSQASFSSMEFWLSRCLSHELFFFFHDGILAITKPFSRTFSFFTMEFWLSRSLSHEFFSFFTMEFWLSRSLSHELFSFFTMEFWLSRSLSHELSFFHDGILEIRNLGEDSFHIYHKEYLHRIRLVKNLAS
jgi:hypothetical protein